ncbi:unnamed protein product [Dovyalis caffra]|uniref:Uncharacterized protein n=1 Tax=Dovyalis caffra TaxID=77055 RepID=A0AAV1S373_9ROSI|nr:unnamed protein product [Dovyalis caffra]
MKADTITSENKKGRNGFFNSTIEVHERQPDTSRRVDVEESTTLLVIEVWHEL